MPEIIPTRIWVDKAYKNCQSGTWHALEAVAVPGHKEYVAKESLNKLGIIASAAIAHEPYATFKIDRPKEAGKRLVVYVVEEDA